MPDIFEIYGWLFTVILWIPVIAILLLVLSPVLFGVGLALYGVGYVAFYAVGFVLLVLALGAPILVPLFIYLASIYESLWFPWLSAIFGFFGLFNYSMFIWALFEVKKEDKAKKDESSAEVGPTTEEPPTPQTSGGNR